MTREDARKFSQLLNGILGEAAQIPARDQAGLHDTVRTLRLHVSQLRNVVDVPTLVAQDQATARILHATTRILNKLEAVIPEGSQAAVVLKLARAELRQLGRAPREEESTPIENRPRDARHASPSSRPSL